jgi:uncharacterized protein YqgV (UPF0045/DUF77 family)
MEVGCQFAVYTLGARRLSPGIAAALAAVRARGLRPEPGPMSTQVEGPVDQVFAALSDAFVAAAGEACVMTVTVSNACPLAGDEAGR